MKRSPAELTGRTFDLLIVGGGIHGAALLREAALQGWEVALIEHGDFGHATSANSLKYIVKYKCRIHTVVHIVDFSTVEVI